MVWIPVVILEDLRLVFVLAGYNDSFLGVALFFEEYPLTMIDIHEWDNALYEVRPGKGEASFIIKMDWVLCEVNRKRWSV